VEASALSRAQAILRTRRHWVQLAKFSVVGAVGYAVNIAVYTPLIHVGVHYLLAATCSFFVAAANNYTLNRFWTFHDRRGHVGVQGMRFLVVSAAALGANLLVLHLLITFGLGKFIGQAVAIVVATPLNFIGNKLWSFRLR
jgi:putative flippase GtrA